MSDYVSEVDVLAATMLAHHVERREMQTRVERLNALLREHGISLPEDDPQLGASDGEHLAACRKVVTTAYALLEAVHEFEQALGELRALVGSGMELVREEAWR